MFKAKTIIVLLYSFTVLHSFSQTVFSGLVLDAESKEPIVGATVSAEGSKKAIAVTDMTGRFSIAKTTAKRFIISYIGYRKLTVSAAAGTTFYLRPEIATVGEVVVTAQETHGLPSASVIGKQAMDHLQPSSFADLLELLPGGRAVAPSLTVPNTIRLREAGGGGTNYDTSSLGTSFVIDGAPVSTNANRAYMAGAWDTQATSRDFTNAGVDMRTISTDDIERVEIVRGIPSVEYGDLTTGLVRIERRKGGNDIAARLKADMKSKLFYVAKGFEWQPERMSLNLSADYLDAKGDPRNRLEQYQRVTLSARLNKSWRHRGYLTSLSTNVDYTGSFDNDKVDPDVNYHQEDSYRSAYNRMAVLSLFDLKMQQKAWFRSFSATVSASYERDRIERRRLVQLSRATVSAATTEEGESDAVILPYQYTAWHDVDSRPLNVFTKLNARFAVPSSHLSNTLLIGVDWNMDKNYGHGQEFDPLQPLYPGLSARQRRLSAVPAGHTLAFYAEETMAASVAGSKVEIVAGIRGGQMLNLPAGYLMHGRIYWDPRVNIGWTMPRFRIGRLPSFVRIAAGIGQHTKTPTSEQLFPDPLYMDLIQLNYYNENPDYRRIRLMTYIIDPTNTDLKPARNLKWEVSTDVNVGGNRLSVTYFREDMKSGFRSQTLYQPFAYKDYDEASIDGSTLTAPPSLDGVPYEWKNELLGHSHYTNGSETWKEGVEYTFASRRIESLHTRLTINGAWFHTIYRNSIEEMERPSQALAGEQVNYAGLYKANSGYESQTMNTNFTLDTDIPRLRLGFSLSAQCLWFSITQRQPEDSTPVAYMDPAGEIHPWTAADAEDAYRRLLLRTTSESLYAKYRVPFSMNLNLKVTKKLLADRLNVAMFCNTILDYTPDYDSNGVTIRRHVTPYFGIETSVKL